MYNFLSAHKTSPNKHPPQPDTKTKHYNGFGWSLHNYYVRLIKKIIH